MQEMLFNAHLAYLSKRTYVHCHSHHLSPCHLLILRRYVFDNYTWDKEPGDFSTFSFNGKLIPARVPLTALLSGTPPFSPPERARV